MFVNSINPLIMYYDLVSCTVLSIVILNERSVGHISQNKPLHHFFNIVVIVVPIEISLY